MHYWNQEERNEKKAILKTAPYDPRFPSTNQQKRCWVNYVDFHKCVKAKGEEDSVCQEFKYVFNEVCPPFWVC
jgi:cytochrome c oxidase subunit 6b